MLSQCEELGNLLGKKIDELTVLHAAKLNRYHYPPDTVKDRMQNFLEELLCTASLKCGSARGVMSRIIFTTGDINIVLRNASKKRGLPVMKKIAASLKILNQANENFIEKNIGASFYPNRNLHLDTKTKRKIIEQRRLPKIEA